MERLFFLRIIYTKWVDILWGGIPVFVGVSKMDIMSVFVVFSEGLYTMTRTHTTPPPPLHRFFVGYFWVFRKVHIPGHDHPSPFRTLLFI